MEARPPIELQPCDVLLYWTPCLVDWIIAIKTWSDVGHAEIYWGDGMSAAARSSGVNLFPFRREGLRYILRPLDYPDITSARRWFADGIQGQGYDWIGLLGFDWPWNHPLRSVNNYERTRMFCSFLVTAFLRAAKTRPFNPKWPSNKVPPGMLKSSATLRMVWSDRSQDLF